MAAGSPVVGNLRLNGLAAFHADRLESARLVRNVPGEVKIIGGSNCAFGRRRVMPVVADHAVARENVAFDSQRPAIQEQLHAVAIGVAGHRQNWPSRPFQFQCGKRCSIGFSVHWLW